MGLSLLKKKIKKKKKFFMGLVCLQIFLMLVDKDIMGLMFIGFFFFFLNTIFYIMTCVILDFNTQMGFVGFNGLSGWLANLGYIAYWAERADGPKGLSWGPCLLVVPWA